MEVIVKDFNVDWLQIKNACRATINVGDSAKEPDSEWKRNLLICRHSPLRLGTVLLELRGVPYYVMGHLVRHNVGVVPFVGTSREDRTGVPREERTQTDPVNMELLVNIEALLNISERRLCTCADINTLKLWKMVIKAINEYDKDIAWACVPQCVAHGGCIEPFEQHCNFYENFTSSKLNEESKIKVKQRYDAYEAVRMF